MENLTTESLPKQLLNIIKTSLGKKTNGQNDKATDVNIATNILSKSNNKHIDPNPTPQNEDEVRLALLEKLCKKLEVSTKNFDKSIMGQCVDLINEYIGTTHHRIQYSYVTHWIFSKFKSNNFFAVENLYDGEIAIILTNLDSLVSYISETDHPSLNQDVYGIIIKLKDHVNLAVHQCELFGNATELLNQQIEDTVKAKMAEETKELTSQLVGLIGIFTALSFIVFGGITSLESIMNNLSNVQNSILPIIILALAWSFCIMNLLYAFMHFVLRIVKINLRNESGYKPNLVQKYPIVWLTNYILLSCLLIFGSIWFVERNGIGNSLYDYFIYKHSTFTFVIGLIAIAVIIILSGFALVRFYLAPKKES